MRTVKDMARLAGISIRTLRYYDEIGLLRPSMLSPGGYRLYDDDSVCRLQQIMFFRELEIPLDKIQTMLDDPSTDKSKILEMQQFLLEKKRNRLDAIIHLIDDVAKGVNTMSFEAFNDEDIQKLTNYLMSALPKENLEKEIAKHGSEENYRKFIENGFKNETAVQDLIKWYGSKEKAMAAMMSPSSDKRSQEELQEANKKLYEEFYKAGKSGNKEQLQICVATLESIYKEMFQLDNARAILIDLAKEYARKDKLAEVTDQQYGEGTAKIIVSAIAFYYGEEI